ncbi:MAG: hypothetical protein ACRDRQ_20375 [Pseudonocardiaceae bacterium]
MSDDNTESYAAARALEETCVRLWGERWALPLAEFTGIAPRTCQRVQANLRAGVVDQRTKGVLIGLHGRLAATMATVEAALK